MHVPRVEVWCATPVQHIMHRPSMSDPPRLSYNLHQQVTVHCCVLRCYGLGLEVRALVQYPDHEGRFRGATKLKGIKDFQAQDYGLVPIKLDTWGQFVFIMADPSRCGCIPGNQHILQLFCPNAHLDATITGSAEVLQSAKDLSLCLSRRGVLPASQAVQ